MLQHTYLGNVFASQGQYEKATEVTLTKRAVESAAQADNKENGALWQADAALQQTAYGYPAEARLTAAEALKLAPKSQGVEIEVALAFAMAGDTLRAESLVRRDKNSLHDPYQLQTLLRS